MLIDGGADPKRLLNHLGGRVPFWDDSLDLVVLTHPHEDHVAGLVEALNRYDVGLALERRFHFPSPDYALWQSALADRRRHSPAGRGGAAYNPGHRRAAGGRLPSREPVGGNHVRREQRIDSDAADLRRDILPAHWRRALGRRELHPEPIFALCGATCSRFRTRAATPRRHRPL